SPVPMKLKRKLAIAGAVAGAVVSLLTINVLAGHSARLVDLVGLFAAAFGSGAALVLAVRGDR
ncbi:MAG: hypothetical protein ABIO38_00665, partial [Luteimonas sp.]